MVSNTFLQRRALKRDDLVTLTRQIGGDYAITGNRDLRGEPLHRGHISVVSFGELSVHTVDVVDLEDFAAEASMPASLSFSFVLNGSVTMTIGGKDLHIGRDAAAIRPEGGYLLLSQPGHFVRRAQRDQRLRAAIVTATPAWFEGRNEEEWKASQIHTGLSGKSRLYGKWSLSSRQAMLAEQLMHPPQFEPFLHNLMLESRAIEAIAEGLRSMTGVKPNAAYSLRQRDRERLEAIKAFIESDAVVGLSLNDMAKRFGVNVKALQRDFRLAFGTTVFHYLKEHRLLAAQEALLQKGCTVAEAAYVAGYLSPANFATAFKKRFGMSPKQVRVS